MTNTGSATAAGVVGLTARTPAAPAGPLRWVGEQSLDQLTQLVRLRVGSDTFPDGAVETGDIVADHERSAGERVVGAVGDEAVARMSGQVSQSTIAAEL